MQRHVLGYEGIAPRITKASTPTRPTEYRTGLVTASPDGKGMHAPLSSGSLLIPVGHKHKLMVTPRFAADAETADLVVYHWQVTDDGTRVCLGRSAKVTVTAAAAEDGRATSDSTGDYVPAAREFDTHGADFVEVRAIAITSTGLDLVVWLK
jgi:hypothetical protein